MESTPFDPCGVIPACLMPFDSNLAIDEAAYRRHLRDLAAVDGIAAITVNGHAAEVHALSFEEQQQALEAARDELGASMRLVAGISSANCREAAGWHAWLPRRGPTLVKLDAAEIERIRAQLQQVGLLPV
jgi:4-hydroxy-tetrahydrodipicolinate synthase